MYKEILQKILSEYVGRIIQMNKDNPITLFISEKYLIKTFNEEYLELYGDIMKAINNKDADYIKNYIEECISNDPKFYNITISIFSIFELYPDKTIEDVEEYIHKKINFYQLSSSSFRYGNKNYEKIIQQKINNFLKLKIKHISPYFREKISFYLKNSILNSPLRETLNISITLHDTFKKLKYISNNIETILENENFKSYYTKDVECFIQNKHIFSNNNINLEDFEDFEDFNDYVKYEIEHHKSKKLAHSILRSYKHLLNEKNLQLFKEIYRLNIPKKELEPNFKKVARFSEETLSETLNKIINAYYGFNKKSIKNNLELISNDIVVSYEEEKSIIVEIKNFEASKKLGSPQWCISYDKSLFNSYNSQKANNTQTRIFAVDSVFNEDIFEEEPDKDLQKVLTNSYIIYNKTYFFYDFSKDVSDPSHFIAFTLSPNNIIINAFDKDDKDILNIIYQNTTIQNFIESQIPKYQNRNKKYIYAIPYTNFNPVEELINWFTYVDLNHSKKINFSDHVIKEIFENSISISCFNFKKTNRDKEELFKRCIDLYIIYSKISKESSCNLYSSSVNLIHSFTEEEIQDYAPKYKNKILELFDLRFNNYNEHSFDFLFLRLSNSLDSINELKTDNQKTIFAIYSIMKTNSPNLQKESITYLINKIKNNEINPYHILDKNGFNVESHNNLKELNDLIIYQINKNPKLTDEYVTPKYSIQYITNDSFLSKMNRKNLSIISKKIKERVKEKNGIHSKFIFDYEFGIPKSMYDLIYKIQILNKYNLLSKEYIINNLKFSKIHKYEYEKHNIKNEDKDKFLKIIFNEPKLIKEKSNLILI